MFEAWLLCTPWKVGEEEERGAGNRRGWGRQDEWQPPSVVTENKVTRSQSTRGTDPVESEAGELMRSAGRGPQMPGCEVGVTSGAPLLSRGASAGPLHLEVGAQAAGRPLAGVLGVLDKADLPWGSELGTLASLSLPRAQVAPFSSLGA